MKLTMSLLLTMSDLMKLVQEALAKERGHWASGNQDDKGTLSKVLAPKKWSEMDLKRSMRKFLEKVEVWLMPHILKMALGTLIYHP